jgi:hypothetical protein
MLPCVGGEQSVVEYPVLTGLGLAAPAGLNAYLPLLIAALVDRFSNRIDLDRPYDFLGSNWGIAILTLLVTFEVVVDKIPGADHINDLIQSIIRPAAGAFLMMAANSDGGHLNPVGAMFIGLILAGAVHAAKATARPAVTISTGGLGNPVVSIVEDFLCVITCVTAVLIPLIVPLFLIAIALVLLVGYRLLFRRREPAQQRPTRPSPPSSPQTLRR